MFCGAVQFGFLPIDTPCLNICVYMDDRYNLRPIILQTVYCAFIQSKRLVIEIEQQRPLVSWMSPVAQCYVSV